MNKATAARAGFALAVFVFFGVAIAGTITQTSASVVKDDEETAALYKTKCGACHGPTALKAYDPEMPMEEQVEAILKGKKGAKPPYMPGFETKGIDTEKATALAEYMKKLRTPEEGS